jgi:hypothetical protein
MVVNTPHMGFWKGMPFDLGKVMKITWATMEKLCIMWYSLKV